MDRITSAYLEDFRRQQALPQGDQPTTFEHFVNYCVLSDVYDDEFNIVDVRTGGDGDLGLDGVAIIANGTLVSSVNEISDLSDTNRYLDIRFIFIQAKSGTNFKGEEVAAFGEGVLEFFADTPSLPTSDDIDAARELMQWIYDHSSQFKRGRPTCELFFATTGKWADDKHLQGLAAKAKARLSDLNLFSKVSFKPLGAVELQGSWQRSNNATSVEFTFANKATLPDINGVTEAYVGVLPLEEFLKIISDQETGSIRKHIFDDNVRDFQGDNPVNSEIAKSLSTNEGTNQFAVLNNGVTLVARGLESTANKFLATDYQIVNGCQTSHVLFNAKDQLPPNLGIPFKVIATNNEELINSITTATNRQTEVKDEDLFALSTFQKQLEAFMSSVEDRYRLYYERRSKQYNVQEVEKVRIITKSLALRAFAAMFLDEPRRAANYYSELKSMVGSSIFNPDHKLDPYYTAAYAYYKLEYFFRNGQLPVRYKPARYHLLTAARHIAMEDEQMPSLTANKMERYCRTLNTQLWDDASSILLFNKAASAIDQVLQGGELKRDTVKVQSFTDAVLKVVRQ
ncbi:AIPR family protein [Zhihengliuella sp.]|uniref:AIPR family protein n=1 Tax=Zhihengliuella sp. TaxID=1954483 RepID=UPI0028114B51|nr:AIPR family protein [Zhihengliuella sp.]